jgi:hypothetical protein
MASIKISDLCTSESSLSVDSESFLDELSKSDLTTTKGGHVGHLAVAVVSWAVSWLS